MSRYVAAFFAQFGLGHGSRLGLNSHPSFANAFLEHLIPILTVFLLLSWSAFLDFFTSSSETIYVVVTLFK